MLTRSCARWPQLITKKRAIKVAAAQQLLGGARRTTGLTNMSQQEHVAENGAPRNWRRRPLGSLGEWYSGGTPSMADESYWSGEIPWVSPKDMKVSRLYDAADHVSERALHNGTRLAPRGALLMVVRGMILAHSFPVARAERPVAFNQDMKALVVGPDVDSEFLLAWLQANSKRLLARADEATHGTKRMPTKTLFAAQVALPPLDEQRAIAEVLSDMDAEIAALEARRDKTKALKQAMMQELLTGRTRLV
jgi:type I restriction enzyme S subunit